MTDPLGRGQPADQRDDVVRGRTGRLGDDEDPVEPRTERRAGHGQRASSATSRRASARTGGRASASGQSTVAPAARACPPPPNRPVRTVASTPPGFVRTRHPRLGAGLLEQDRDLGRVGLREQVDDPLGMGAAGAAGGQVGVGQASTRRCGPRRSSRAGRARGRRAGAGRPAWSGTAVARSPTSGAPASTSAAATASVRGVAFGWAKVAVSMTMPAISAAASPPPPASSGIAEPGREERDHLARRGGVRVDPVGVPVGVVRGVVVDDDPRQAGEQLGVPVADVPDPLERAAVGDHDQVVRRGGVRIGPEPLDAVEEVVQRRDRVGADRIGAAAPFASTRRTTPSVAPSVSASGFSWPTASTRRAPRRRSTTDSGTASRYGPRSTVTGRASAAHDRTTCAPMPAGRPRRWPRGRGGTGRPDGRRRLLAEVTGVGQPRDRGRQRFATVGSPSGTAPVSSSSSSCRTRVPRSAVSSSWTCRSGMRRSRSRPPSSRRTNGIARPSAAIAASRSAGCPMTLTQTLAWRRSGVVSTR